VAQLLDVEKFVVGSFSTNCYVVSCNETLSSVIIDPGFENEFEAEKIFSYIEGNGLKTKLIVCTHGHPDHTCGDELARIRFHVPVYIHKDDAFMLGASGRETAKFFGFSDVSQPSADFLLREGDRIEVGRKFLKVLHTPGHSPGSVTLLCGEQLFSGDTLFAGSIGRTDFPGSSDVQMRSSLKKLVCLSDSLTVYPGHGLETNLGMEKQANPFLVDL
jgi:hydroxyacylglutathione hydrolase